MSETLSLPVLPLDDTVVLPTMVVPVDISGAEVRASIEAAQLSAGPGQSEARPQVLLVPRLDGKYSPFGTLGDVEQIGRAAQRRASRGDPRPGASPDRHRDRGTRRRPLGRRDSG